MVADLLHRLSDRRESRLVKISCAAIPDDLLESELFGFERGAFTGANIAKPGKFELANGGTLFLDEIAEMSTRLQAKLLRVLQDGIFQRLGSTRDIQIDVRVISATHVDLNRAIEEKTFREDLYYRLNVTQITAPALRNRRDDIPLLAAAFLRRYTGAMERDVRAIHEEAMEQLLKYSWPGNVRELENTIQRAVALAEGPVILDFPMLRRQMRPRTEAPEGASGLCFPIGTPLSEIEEKAIRATLEHCGGNKERAARTLGVSARTLYRFFEREDD
jgi:two-component system response regulator HydG